MRTLGYRRSYLAPLLAAVLCLGLLLGCGGDGSESGASREETSNLERSGEGDLELGGVVTEQDIAVARGHHDVGRLLWQSADLDAYTLEVALETVGVLRVQVVDGEVVSEEETSLNGNSSESDSWDLPGSVDALFERVDSQIARFEDDPSLVLEPGECGNHLNASFDPELGYPTYYDGLGPCDDGVGIRASVIPG